ncbi:MazG nucleotide pyrophosphohydrolase domain-containing protein [Desulfogranum japonicum]|uniref:MazG nucleotide pyrophosphohydrolase domain-containing protein n=1 Tax=Desulfogranum japonicum TaxID=231447 RepID=UPI0003FCF760|nr:MazG nucleotide pyrophosphohydrolase domain-containing protein [Desulfogranum japonicum]
MNSDVPLSDLLATIATLRGEQGCPWDKKQTPQSLKKYLLEECRELAEAIDNDDQGNICEEIGDMYFILGMLSTMYAEAGIFPLDMPLKKINEKMIRRHPHVFAGTSYNSEEDLCRQWETIKSGEK